MKRAITNKNWISYLFAYEDGLVSECQAIALARFIRERGLLQRIEGYDQTIAQTLVNDELNGKVELRPRKFL